MLFLLLLLLPWQVCYYKRRSHELNTLIVVPWLAGSGRVWFGVVQLRCVLPPPTRPSLPCTHIPITSLTHDPRSRKRLIFSISSCHNFITDFYSFLWNSAIHEILKLILLLFFSVILIPVSFFLQARGCLAPSCWRARRGQQSWVMAPAPDTYCMLSFWWEFKYSPRCSQREYCSISSYN